MIRVESVTKSYGGRRVIDHLTFEVKADETAVVIGPSGSGKSTALRLLLRLAVPDGGQVMFDGAHAAQKSTNTGFELSSTSRLKFASVRVRYFLSCAIVHTSLTDCSL